MSKFWCKKARYNLTVEPPTADRIIDGDRLVNRVSSPGRSIQFENHEFVTEEPKLLQALEVARKRHNPGFLVVMDEDGTEVPVDDRQWVPYQEAMRSGLGPGELKSLVESHKLRVQEREGKKSYSSYDISEAVMAKLGSATDKGR